MNTNPIGSTGETQDLPTEAKPVTTHKSNTLTEGSALWHVSRVIVVIAAITLSPILVPVIISTKSGSYLKEQYSIKFLPNSVIALTRKMKAAEEKQKLETMKATLSSCETITDEIRKKTATNAIKEKILNKENLQQIKKDMALRCILREMAKTGKLTPESKLDVESAVTFNENGDIAINQSNDSINCYVAKKILKNIESEVNANTTPTPKDIADFQASLETLVDILDNSEGKDVTEVNRQFISALRNALNSPVYQALKHDPDDPSVQLLHRFACDIWNKAPSMDSYLAVGQGITQKMSKKTPSEKETTPDKPLPPGAALADKLESSRAVVAKEHWTDHGLFHKFVYAITHPYQAMGSMASEGGKTRLIPAMVGRGVYDSHGLLSNNPSLQGVTTLELTEGKKATVNNCYGGSPTINNEISPEFLAVLQAAENNQFAKKPDPNIPQMINYTNLQNIEKKHGEGERSRAIMALNDRYPLSFCGITLTKDSPLYMMKKNEDVVWESPAKFGEVMRERLAQEGQGYHFPGDKEKWGEIFDQIIASANNHFEAYQGDATPRQLQGAYQEYVYSMLNAVIEMESIKTLQERGVDAPQVMCIKACKENIDRGGMENTKYMYTRLPSDAEQREDLLKGVMHSRALSTRDRVLLKNRMPQVLDFMRTTEPEKFQSDLADLFTTRGYGVQKTSFTPALNQ